MSYPKKDNMTLNLHYRYAVKTQSLYIALDEEGKYSLTSDKDKAEARWDMRGALGIRERYLSATWNITMGDKPEFEITKIHRPQHIHHWW